MANIDKITLRGVNYSIVDSSVPSYVKGITQTDITNWNNKPDSFTETDPTVPSHVKSITEQDISNWNNKLDSFTETDPIFTASAAHGITASDISNWNSKTDNVGTITGITMNNTSKGTSGIVDLGTVLTEHQSLSSYATSANYDSNTKKIYLKHNNTVLSEIDATDFIKDGMVDTAYVDGSYLTISFNTDAGKEPVNIEISDIFDPTNYYDKPTVDEKVESLMQNQKLSFYTTGTCSVNVYTKDDSLNGDYSQQTPTSTFEYSANTLVQLNIADNEHFEIDNPNDCINIIYSWPGACEKFYDWFMSVDMFCNMIFNFNKMDHSAWEHSTSDGTKYKFGVVEAQYRNCVFWWDVALTNVNVHCYTLHKTQECPLFYSTIPENTYKTLVEPYNITNNPNFTNEVFLNSMALSSCRSALSYSHTRSVPFGCWQDAGVVTNIIKINGDCRTFLAWSGAEDTAVFDCETVTNFGYRLSGGSMYWNGFYECRNLKNLMLKNLKVSVNLSWSPISQYSLNYIINNAANTSAITIALSPYTWYNLTDSIKTTAESKNINLILDKSHYSDMQDMKIWDDVEGIKNSYLSADNLDLTSYVSKTELNAAGYISSFTETDPTVPSYVKGITETDITNWNNKQDVLISGTNIKTINNNSLLGSGDISIEEPLIVKLDSDGSFPTGITGTTITNAVTDGKFVEIIYENAIYDNIKVIDNSTGEFSATAFFPNVAFDDFAPYYTPRGLHYDSTSGMVIYPNIHEKLDPIIIGVYEEPDEVGDTVLSLAALSYKNYKLARNFEATLTTNLTGTSLGIRLMCASAVISNDIDRPIRFQLTFPNTSYALMDVLSISSGIVNNAEAMVITSERTLVSYNDTPFFVTIYLSIGYKSSTNLDLSTLQVKAICEPAIFEVADEVRANVPNLITANGVYNALNSYVSTTELNNAAYVTQIQLNNAGYTTNIGTITGITMNGTSKGTSGVVDLGTVITAHQSLDNYITKSDLNSASYLQSFTETDPTVPAHVKSITQQNINDWNNKLSSETQLSKGTTTGSGNAVTDISVSNHQITLTKGSTFLTSHQDIKTINNQTITGTGNVTINELPTVTSSDNGKVLQVVNGQWQLITPLNLYSGTGAPNNSQGNNGDLYMQI